MLAYHGNAAIKTKLLAQLQAHHDADEIVKGKYWEGGKGCAVGCTVHSSNHADYETKLGIPEMLARLEDIIFEGLPNNKAKEWPIIFIKAAMRDNETLEQRMLRLKPVGYQFMYWNLTENLILKDSDNAEVQKAIIQCREAIKQCAEVICPLAKGEKFVKAAWSAARSAAWLAAWSAAESAAWLAAWSAAESAAWSAARSAWLAAWSAAESAAESAARSAAWSAAWSAARSAESAESAAYEKMADKIIELIENAA